MANPSPLLQFVEALDQVADKADVDVETVIQKLIAAHSSVGERAFWGVSGKRRFVIQTVHCSSQSEEHE